MKIWITTLFYLICFFALALVIYRLGFFVPPEPGDSRYQSYCLHIGILAALISGMNIATALVVEWLLHRQMKSDNEKN